MGMERHVRRFGREGDGGRGDRTDVPVRDRSPGSGDRSASEFVRAEVWKPVSDRRSMTVFLPERDCFRQVGAFASRDVLETLRPLDRGRLFRAEMIRMPDRGSCWKVVHALL
jgi:hypothetical protein